MNSGISLKWWGYLHVDGTLHVKRYFFAKDLLEADESPFVKSIHGPWEAMNRDEALDKLAQELNFLSLPLKNLGKK